MDKKILIIGAGGHRRVVAEVARDCGYNEIKYLDDKSDIAIGKIVNLEKLKKEYAYVFCWYRT